jgi:Cytochrome c
MRKSIILLSALAIVVITVVTACSNSSAENKVKASMPDSTAMVMRGKYLVNAVGCDDCHSPKRMGPNGPEIIPELRLSGFPHDAKLPPVNVSEVKKGWSLMSPDLTAAVGPWGASFAGNITSSESGIGNWTEENFIRALRHGKYKGLEGSRDLLPPMPWFVYKNMNDKDLKAIFAFLKTTAPVENIVPAPKPLAELK